MSTEKHKGKYPQDEYGYFGGFSPSRKDVYENHHLAKKYREEQKKKKELAKLAVENLEQNDNESAVSTNKVSHANGDMFRLNTVTDYKNPDKTLATIGSRNLKKQTGQTSQRVENELLTLQSNNSHELSKQFDSYSRQVSKAHREV